MKPIQTSRAAMLAVAALLLPLALAAQTTDPILDREHDAAIAVAYDGAPGAIEKALLLHGQVVHDRQLLDTRRFECLKSHANLLYYYGRLEGARLYLEAAAKQAAFEGRDYEAAMTYIEAAIVAKEAGKRATVQRLAEQASALGASERLDPDQRAEILARIGQ